MEEWKDIVGYEGFYQVSNLGRVRSLDRMIKHPRPQSGLCFLRGRIMKIQTNLDGYSMVMLQNGGYKYHQVHRLVAMAFIPNKDNKREVNHKNGIKKDNSIDNLEWCSRSENIRHNYNFKRQCLSVPK